MADESIEEGLSEIKPENNSNNEKSISRSPILIVLLTLNLVILGGLGFMQWQLFTKMNKKESIQDVVAAEMSAAAGIVKKSFKKDDGILVSLDGFTANLAQGDGPRRFVRLEAVLKFNKKHSQKEFDARKPQIRDTIISILNSKRPKDLLEKQGKEYLKEEIKSAINNFMIDGTVMDVFYVGFQIN
jgi:flagellar protein FliL